MEWSGDLAQQQVTLDAVTDSPASPGRGGLGGCAPWGFAAGVLGAVCVAVPFALMALSLPRQVRSAGSGVPLPAEVTLNTVVEAALLTVVLPGVGLWALAFSPWGRAVRARVRREMGVPWLGAADGLLLAPFQLLVVSVVGAVAFAALRALGTPAAPGSLEGAWWLLVLVSIVAGVGEELLFRGVLMGVLARWPRTALVGQAAFFGLLHAGYGNWVHPVAIMVFGLLAGVLARRFGLLALMVAHAVYDVLLVTMQSLHGLAPWGGYVAAVLLFLVLNLGLVVGVLLWRDRARLWAAARGDLRLEAPTPQ